MIKNILLLILFSFVQLKAQTLNYYFGNIHSHSSYSDGNKDSATSGMTKPYEDFLYAKQSLHTDFYGISEHNHQSAGIKSPNYFNRGLRDADSITTDGEFVAMYGMEWGVISSGGHVILYGFDSLVGWDFSNKEIFVNEADYSSLWKTINRKRGTFAYLAHPQSSDYGNILNSQRNAIADSAIVGMAIRSGPAFSTNNTYSNPSTSNYVSRYNDALKIGYHLGVGIDHDTHNSVFSRQTQGRLVVMAPILNRAEIINGIKQMKFYASDDWNSKVDFKINNLPMGSIITNSGNPTISLSLDDPDNESVSSIALYYGIPGSGIAPTILTTVNNTSSLNYVHSIPNNSSYYYYAYISQSDGNKIWTSPIWYNRNDNTVIVAPIANFSTLSGCINQEYLLQDSSLNNPTSWWWEIPGGYPSNSSLQNPVISFPTTGSYNVSLTVSNQAGTSTTITKTINIQNPPNVTIAAVDSICKGKYISLHASGANSYLWSNGSTDSVLNVQALNSIRYYVKGFENSCFDTTSISLNVYQAISTPSISESNDTLFSSSLVGNQWYLNNAQLLGQTNNYLVLTQTGVYITRISDSFGCISEFSLPYNFQPSASLEEIDALSEFNIFPNPASGVINIISKENYKEIEVSIIDILGRKVYQENLRMLSKNSNHKINLDKIISGIYLVKLKANNQVFSTKIRIE